MAPIDLEERIKGKTFDEWVEEFSEVFGFGREEARGLARSKFGRLGDVELRNADGTIHYDQGRSARRAKVLRKNNRSE